MKCKNRFKTEPLPTSQGNFGKTPGRNGRRKKAIYFPIRQETIFKGKFTVEMYQEKLRQYSLSLSSFWLLLD